jgi:hypothetical protein
MNQRKAEDRVRELMARHGLDEKWGFSWLRSKTQQGLCVLYGDGTGSVQLSLPWAEANGFSADFVEPVSLHEIAHALVGPQLGHGDVWSAKCAEIGGEPGETSHRFEPPHRFRVSCPCGARYGRERPAKPGRIYLCAACGRSLQWPVVSSGRPKKSG